MVALPAITFLGLKGAAAWAAVAAAGLGGYVVVTRVMPSLGLASGGSSGVASGPGMSDLAAFARAISEDSGRVAVAAMGPGASLGIEGIRVARGVTTDLARFAESQTRVIGDTSREIVRSQTDLIAALTPRVASGGGFYAPPPVVSMPTAPTVQGSVPTIITAARVAAPPPPPPPTTYAAPPISYPAPPAPLAQYFPTSSSLAAAVTAAAVPNAGKTAIKLVTGEWVYV